MRVRDEREAYLGVAALAILAALRSVRTPRSMTRVSCDAHDFLHALQRYCLPAASAHFLPIVRARLAHGQGLLGCRSTIAVDRCIQAPAFNRNLEKPEIFRAELGEMLCWHPIIDLAQVEVVAIAYFCSQGSQCTSEDKPFPRKSTAAHSTSALDHFTGRTNIMVVKSISK
jgi:hypothetical protein